MALHYVQLFGEHTDNAMAVLDHGIPDAITPKLHTVVWGGAGDC